MPAESTWSGYRLPFDARFGRHGNLTMVPATRRYGTNGWRRPNSYSEGRIRAQEVADEVVLALTLTRGELWDYR